MIVALYGCVVLVVACLLIEAVECYRRWYDNRDARVHRELLLAEQQDELWQQFVIAAIDGMGDEADRVWKDAA